MHKFKNLDDIEYFMRMPTRKDVDDLATAAFKDSTITEWVYLLAKTDRNPSAWRASWALVHINIQCPHCLDAFEQRMIKDYHKMPTDRQQASILQILTTRNFDIDEAGELFDAAIQNLIVPNKQMYVRMYSLKFLEHFVKMVPELANELIMVIEGENNLPPNHSIKLALKRIEKNLK